MTLEEALRILDESRYDYDLIASAFTIEKFLVEECGISKDSITKYANGVAVYFQGDTVVIKLRNGSATLTYGDYTETAADRTLESFKELWRKFTEQF